MRTRIIEAEHSDICFNYGKFMVARFDDEWKVRSGLYEVARHVTDEVLGEGTYEQTSASNPGARPLLAQLGWTPEFVWVCDLQTGEGAFFRPGGSASADLAKHRIWVCPLFEPFLRWLYDQDLTDLDALPVVVRFTAAEAPPAAAGYRRTGPHR